MTSSAGGDRNAHGDDAAAAANVGDAPADDQTDPAGVAVASVKAAISAAE